jgi:hypothetical protein
MGYNVHSDGYIKITPALNQAELDFLNQWNNVHSAEGFKKLNAGINDLVSVSIGGWCELVFENNEVDDSEFTAMRAADESQRYYDNDSWMRFFINEYLTPEAREKRAGDPRFADFSFNHVANGEMTFVGEDNQNWCVRVTNDDVEELDGIIVYVSKKDPVAKLSLLDAENETMIRWACLDGYSHGGCRASDMIIVLEERLAGQDKSALDEAYDSSDEILVAQILEEVATR